MKSVKTQNSRPRGRPRSAEARAAILAAAAKLIEESGIGAVTMEAVAQRAGVGKPTVYRSWPNREALAMAALMANAAPKTSVRETSSSLDDLRRQLRKVVEAFSTSRGRSVALMTASADPNSELSKAFRNQIMLASREEGRAILARAVAEGEVRPNIRIEVVLDMIYGPIFYRLLIGHAPIGEAFAGHLIDEALKGLAPASSGLS
jgi:AcrR family transcriptional regulator